MRLVIDAANIGGGGGITHLKEILKDVSAAKELFGICEIIIFISEYPKQYCNKVLKIVKKEKREFNKKENR